MTSVEYSVLGSVNPLLPSSPPPTTSYSSYTSWLYSKELIAIIGTYDRNPVDLRPDPVDLRPDPVDPGPDPEDLRPGNGRTRYLSTTSAALNLSCGRGCVTLIDSGGGS
mgnify:CR=1 FL=1